MWYSDLEFVFALIFNGGTMNDDKQVDLSDLNALALNEFKKLIAENEELDSKWRNIVTELVKDGIPQNLDSLEIILGGKDYVKN